MPTHPKKKTKKQKNMISENMEFICLLSLRINQSTETPDNLYLIIHANLKKNMIPTQQTYVCMKKYEGKILLLICKYAKNYLNAKGKPQ
jgi:hypothetical protein